MLPLVDHAGLPSDEREALRRALQPLRMLEDVVRWVFSLTPRGELVQVVVQDEFTHDVVLRWRASVHLVFDTT